MNRNRRKILKKIGKLFLVGMMTFIGMMLPMKVQAADMPANPVDKPGYTLDYADEFNGDSLICNNKV